MRTIIFLFVAVLLLGCSTSDRPAKPENLISKDKMSDVIYDVFVLNAAKGINKTILENHGIMPQEYVYKKHKIDSLQFAKSNDYYAYDTKIYESIIDKVKQKLEVEKAKNEALILKEDKTRDSLNKIKKKAKKPDSISQKLKIDSKEFK